MDLQELSKAAHKSIIAERKSETTTTATTMETTAKTATTTTIKPSEGKQCLNTGTCFKLGDKTVTIEVYAGSRADL